MPLAQDPELKAAREAERAAAKAKRRPPNMNQGLPQDEEDTDEVLAYARRVAKLQIETIEKMADRDTTKDKARPLHYTLFVSVAVAAILFLPVLLLKMDLFDDGSFLSMFGSTTKFFLLIEQILASLSVPMVGINLILMVRKLRRIEGLQDKLELLSAGGHVLAETPRAAA